MKKGLVFLLLALAIIVLVSPGIVGRLAEESMDENLDWAATESQDISITSLGFDRGWFSSEGQHRVELHDGELRDAMLAIANDSGAGDLPVLIIDTRLDHGLVPVASMSRDKGSLVPGLGSAISTLSLEFESGETVDLPGTIYSNVGLTGELQSNFVLEPGSYSHEGETAHWGDTDVLITTSPAANNIGFSGAVESLEFVSLNNDVSLGTIEFKGNQAQTKFGFSVGDAIVTMASLTLPSEYGTDSVGPFEFSAESEIENDQLSGRTKITLDDLPFDDFGRANMTIDATISGVDGAAVGNISRTIDNGAYANSEEMMLALEGDLKRLLAAGFELRFDQFDIALQQGTVRTKIEVDVAATDVDEFNWIAALLALDVTLELSVPGAVVDLATSIDSQFNAAAGMGFLRKNGAVYEMEAAFQKGLLTVNGAPMPIPIPGIQ